MLYEKRPLCSGHRVNPRNFVRANNLCVLHQMVMKCMPSSRCGAFTGFKACCLAAMKLYAFAAFACSEWAVACRAEVQLSVLHRFLGSKSTTWIPQSMQRAVTANWRLWGLPPTGLARVGCNGDNWLVGEQDGLVLSRDEGDIGVRLAAPGHRVGVPSAP